MGTSKEEGDLDIGHVETLLKTRTKLGDKPTTTIRIFEKNNFFYLFDKDGELAAAHIYGSVTATKMMGKKNPVSYCYMNHNNFESLLRFLILVKHFRVEIYKFVKTGYELEVRASPGNIAAIEHILYGESDTVKDCNYLAGVRLVAGSAGDSGVKVGFAAVDSSLNTMKVCDFVDTESFAGLESALVQLNPREVVIPQSDQALTKKLEQMLTKNRILVTQKPMSDYLAMSEADIKRVCNAKTNVISLSENCLASSVCTALLKYLGIHSDPQGNLYNVELLNLTDYMRIDHRTVDGLNLFDYTGLVGASIFQILNKTRTPGGARLLQTWIKQPLIQLDMIRERLDLVEQFVQNSDVRQSLYDDHLRKMPDFQRISTKFQNKKANLQDMYKVYVAITKLRGLRDQLESFGEDAAALLVKENFIKDINEALKDFEKYMQLVETTMDLDQVRNGHFLIMASFDEELGELRQSIDSVDGRIKNTLKSAGIEYGVEPGKVLKLEHSSYHGYFFRLTLKEEKAVRNDKSITILESNKTGIKFRNKKLDTLNDEYSELSEKYEHQQSAIVAEMLGIASGYTDIMNHLGMLISKLDVIVSLSLAAVSAPNQYIKPEMLPQTERKMRVTGLRHPIVELQESVSFIPNDVEFEQNNSTFHIITGPNMGGKSTYIRSVGVAVLMAQIGSFVPADSAQFSVVDSIMVRIGASDCQMKGISTFMAEMLETSNIIESATENSLILIDELGRGTSTYDGFGIAWAVSEHIAKEIRCFTLFTTHYTELTKLADEVATVSNYHVTALVDDSRLTLLYQIQPGICDKSFGIHVAKLANFPNDVIEDASKRLEKLERGLPVAMEVN